jgi:lysophospholipase L1-like esterase
VKQAADYVENDQSTKKAVVLHIIGNDLKNKDVTPEKNGEEIVELVKNTKKKYPSAKVILSLATPRGDSLNWALKAEKTNKIVTDNLSKDENVSFVDNWNLGVRGMIKPELFETDKVHLSPMGTARLASNIKAALG